MYYYLDETLSFPSHEYADNDGLLAVGGDLSTERLLLAYSHGIFPWYSEEQPILWWSPDPRFVLFLEDFHLTKKQLKTIKKSNFLITENTAFATIIDYCATVPRKDGAGTWITDEIKNAYCTLHQKGYAHSIEIWHTTKPTKTTNCIEKTLNDTPIYLVGGLYGILTKNVFCGESMFSLMPEASRCALYYLVNKLKEIPTIKLIDCQIESPHFLKMGAKHISRQEFLSILYA